MVAEAATTSSSPKIHFPCYKSVLFRSGRLDFVSIGVIARVVVLIVQHVFLEG